MSEKRFKMSKYVTPSSVSYFCDENGRMLNKEVVKVLNEQQSIIRRDEISIKTMMSNMKKLEEENEQLKKYLKIHNESELSSIEYNLKLYEENEQLRKKLDNFKPVMFQDMQKGTVRLYSKGGNDE